MKIALTTIGCKLNQSEIIDLKTKLQNNGYILVDKNSPHDLHIFNACSVTHGAEQITRQKIREVKRKHGPKIFVMGCLNKTIPEINKTFTSSQKAFTYITKNFPVKIRTSNFRLQTSKTRVLIKIQSGCDFSCTYCIIHKFRGKSQSIPLNKIITQIKSVEKQGLQEIVLVGQNILQYKNQGLNFTRLVKEILKQTNIPRIRFSSLDPRLVNRDFLALIKNPRICPHLHLSLQSGSDKILKSMNRSYTGKKYLSIVNQAQKINPLTSITTDIIVGFPDETDKNFQDTLTLVSKINFLKIHIFPYSVRSGTQATNLKNEIDSKTKKERFNKLNALAKKRKTKFLKKMSGKTLSVLFEHRKNGLWQGFTPNYIQIKKRSAKNLQNKIVDVKI